jgi:hypothetical protein
MSIESIIEAIDLEIARLQSAKSLLSQTSPTKRKVGRPTKTIIGVAAAESKKTIRTLSPEARKRIADAQRLRWKKQKSAAKAA